ncbi:MAG: hypothetical protein NZM35_02805 [Chitinophagales bacterium]|nr:hypothetical protein [Chitinophagales bacterium]MDW8418119.1 hypothetical protein [Chitinophagales bacterium]
MSFFNRINIYYLLQELMWWAITALIAIAILYPIDRTVYYLYYRINFAIIFVAITYFRYTISMMSLPFLHGNATRFLLFTANIALFFYFASYEQKFLSLLDNFFTEDFGFPREGVIMYHDVKERFFKYLSTQLIFSNTAALIMIVAFNIRLIISWWQLYKYKSSMLMED